MLLETQNSMKNILTAQIVKIAYPQVTARDESGQVIEIATSEKERTDPLFWAALKNILKAGLWVPVGRHFHQLLDFDWMAPATEKGMWSPC